MHIIKLDAIESTNTFLKDLALNGSVKNFTVVSAENQFKGRGQMGASWSSEAGKNLMCSVFVRDMSMLLKDVLYLNLAVSMAVYTTLSAYDLPKLSVKWPNDILSEKGKLGGILIENTIDKKMLRNSIIGIGLNVNQTKFSSTIGKVTSMKKHLNIDVDKEVLFTSLLENLKNEIVLCTPQNYQKLKERYLSVLYKYQEPAMYENTSGQVFMGKIVGVNSVGDLQLEMQDESIQEFGLKEIKLLR